MKKIDGGATIWARKTIDSVIFYDKPSDWFKIWFFIVNQVNHSKYRKWEKGQGFMTYSQIMEKTKTTRGQVDMCLRFLKKSQMLTTHKTTRGMIVSVLKYDLYQDLKNYKNDTKNEIGTIQERYRNDTINKNDKNDKNDKKIETPPRTSEKKSFIKMVETCLPDFEEKIPNNILKGETQKFILYWTEKNPNGKKEKWEMQQTFDVKRRLASWLKNTEKWDKQKLSNKPHIIL